MGSFIYFAIIGIQITSTFVTGSIPLKCFLQNQSLLNVFGKNADVSPSHVRFNALKKAAVTLDKDGWVLETTNLEYQGLDDAVLEDYGFNFVSNVMHVTFYTDMVITHPYKTSGTLFSLPIYGEGPGRIDIKNLQFGFKMPFDIKEINGQKFIELKEFDYWFNVREKVEFNFSNLYNGNKELSDSMHLLLNQNWKSVSIQFGKTFMDPVATGIYNTFRDHMLSTPLKNVDTC